eukprot:359434-Chlamydomonas_euryale.AAC.3
MGEPSVSSTLAPFPGCRPWCPETLPRLPPLVSLNPSQVSTPGVPKSFPGCRPWCPYDTLNSAKAGHDQSWYGHPAEVMLLMTITAMLSGPFELREAPTWSAGRQACRVTLSYCVIRPLWFTPPDLQGSTV